LVLTIGRQKLADRKLFLCSLQKKGETKPFGNDHSRQNQGGIQDVQRQTGFCHFSTMGIGWKCCSYCLTVLDAKDFSTLLHDTYWKRLGYSQKFDFVAKKVYFDGNVPDADKAKTAQDFNESFSKYNLNWHSDLIILTLLPYKENRTFKINFFDPGFGKAQEAVYTVKGGDVLTNASGEKVDCWILEHRPTPGNSYQRF
jgi:hypothetical protein